LILHHIFDQVQHQKKKKKHKKSQKKKINQNKKKYLLPYLQPATPERYEAMPCPTEAIEGAPLEIT
jgi:hypothetical protein